MTKQPTQEEKEHILKVLADIQDIFNTAEQIKKLPVKDRMEIGRLLQELKAELAEFRRMYPDA